MREFLALAPKKGQGLGKGRILEIATEGGREMSLLQLHYLEIIKD